ncbi:hypothetical protein LCI18_002121 [Fusarium solani-melongenae]|uniref:Uncharacterized protein n=1 Tax=Fusarium solani subsp. cucurbitae TaxID=2747967 RepID=A0ACD3YQM7_FUSSC|nr:hypothetical protein LCI18_002121 [Fusarium solani-melongenae]
MAYNEEKTSVTTAQEQIRLAIESISNSNKAKSLALINSRAELDFQLRLALFELGNDRSLSQNKESLSTFAGSLLEVFWGFDEKDNDGRSKTEAPPRRSQPTLARGSYDEAEPPKRSSIRLPETAEELKALTQQILRLRNPNPSPPGVLLDPEVGHDRTTTHPRATNREGYDVNKGYESEKENERHSFQTSEAGISSNGPDSNYSQDTITVEPQSISDDARKSGKKFLDQADDFYEFYKKHIKPQIKGPIKVAVLDTGLNLADNHFLGLQGQSLSPIKERKSFIGDSTHDTCGHGTEVAALVFKMAPHVKLYIGKVCEGKRIIGVGQFVKKTEKTTNIDKIRDAITKAEAQGILIFAAASNDGANSPRAFPTCIIDKVLAIHATDGHGNPCGINPTPLKQHFNFSTLGAGIPSLLDKPNVLKAATSFSTPIAAGMAANILTLAQTCLDDWSLRRLAFQKGGMQAILLNASIPRDHYNYLCPNEMKRDSTEHYGYWLMDVLKKL